MFKKGFFNGLFDLNGDGELDSFERAVDMAAFVTFVYDDEENSEENDDKAFEDDDDDDPFGFGDDDDDDDDWDEDDFD